MDSTTTVNRPLSYPLLPCLMALAFLLLLPSVSHAATRKVPSIYATIQAGIDAAQSGDTVLVGDGTFRGTGNRDLSFGGKSLTVQSEHGPTKTILDCQGTSTAPHRGFYIHNAEPSVTLEGLAITGGYESSYGGGVYIAESTGSVTLTNCAFYGNQSVGNLTNGGGGGVYVNSSDGGAVTLSGCTFHDNTTSSSSNSSNNSGGGALIVGSNATLAVEQCTFRNNTVLGNTASGGGAYLSNVGGTVTVTNSVFRANQLLGNDSNSGGGIYIDATPNLLVAAGPVTLTNCTFNGNTNDGDTSGRGGGCVVVNPTGQVQVINCIAYGEVEFASELYFDTNSSSTVVVTYSDVRGGFPGTGNRNVDPKFVNAAAGDLHLQPSSPCLSAGTHTGAPTTDLDGTARPNPPSLGAYDIAFALKSMTLSPAAVYGGETSTGTVTLTRPAPAGGASVSLFSNTGYAPVSSPVTIAAGTSSKTFTVTSKPVTATKAATITAGYNGRTQAASLIIYPPDLKFLNVSPSTVKGGSQNSVAMVTLTSPAPAGGVLVTLSSNTGYALVPRSILVPAGGRVAAFTVVTKPVSANKAATITARHGSVTKSVAVILTP